MLERIDDDPAFFRLALVTQGTVSQGGAAVGTELALIGLNIARLISDVYVEGVASGIFRDIDPDKATTFIGQQIYGAMSVRAGEPLPTPAAEAAAEMCDFLLTGWVRDRPGRWATATEPSARPVGAPPTGRDWWIRAMPQVRGYQVGGHQVRGIRAMPQVRGYQVGGHHVRGIRSGA